MNIGQFKRNTQGVYYGHIAAAKIDLGRLALRPVKSTNERAPLFAVIAQNPGNRAIQIGSLWEATSNSTGEIFLQGSVDDPSLPDRLPIALFGDGEGGYRVAWRRPRRREVMVAPEQGAGDELAPGPGRAGAIGEDEIPF